jgi:hypothetical protein
MTEDPSKRVNTLYLKDIFFAIRHAIRAGNEVAFAEVRLIRGQSTADLSVTSAKHCRSGAATRSNRQRAPIRTGVAGITANRTQQRAPLAQRPLTIFQQLQPAHAG